MISASTSWPKVRNTALYVLAGIVIGVILGTTVLPVLFGGMQSSMQEREFQQQQ